MRWTRIAGSTGSTRGGAPAAFFEQFTPEVATVTVTTDRGTSRQEVRPTYATSRPNGDDCPPVCRQGTVTVSLPA